MSNSRTLPELSKTELLEKVESEQVRRSLTAFKRHMYRRYKHAPHLELIDQALMQTSLYAETEGKQGIGFLIVSVPPRNGKTLTCSRLYPAWHLGRNPDHRIIEVSYAAKMVEKNSRAARNLIRSPQYQKLFPGITLAFDSKAADAWNIEGREGGMDAAGIGGGVTGKGGNIILIDDPVKSRAEAESETERENLWEWYTSDLYTRREPGAAVLLIMTRWHSDDLAGKLLKHEPEKWHYLRLPAIAEESDPLGREPGAALWPERFDLDFLNDMRATQGPYAWAGLYQQRPAPAEGGIFKRENFKRIATYELPTMAAIARYWDLAMSSKNSADYSVGVLLGLGVDGYLYVLDVKRRQLEWGDVTPFIADVTMSDGTNIIQGIEQKAYMSRAVGDLNADPRLRGYSVFGYPADVDKLTRALPFAAKVAAGMVRVIDAGWTNDYIEEMCGFPNGSNDDQVDASSGALAMHTDGLHDAAGGLNYALDTYSDNAY